MTSSRRARPRVWARSRRGMRWRSSWRVSISSVIGSREKGTLAPERSRRLQNLPGYPLADVPEARRRLEAAGVEVIDLGAGDADLDPPPEAVHRLAEAASQRSMSRYPFQSGLPDLREAIATWMSQRFGVSLDPYTEILPLMGSKEGITKLPLVFLDPG